MNTNSSSASSTCSPSPTTLQQSFKNQFSNDGSFFEQFKKLKQAKDEPKIESRFEPKVEPKVEVQSKSVEDDWYKAALARAKQIAQNMSAPPPGPPPTKIPQVRFFVVIKIKVIRFVYFFLNL